MDYSDVRVATAMQATGIVVPVETERLCTLTSTVIVEHLHYDARLRRLRRDYAEDDDAPHVPKGAVLSRVEVAPPCTYVALRTRASGILLVLGDADGCRDLLRCGVHVADDSDLVLLGDEGAATARLVYTLHR
jgi:hypothetical protein